MPILIQLYPITLIAQPEGGNCFPGGMFPRRMCPRIGGTDRRENRRDGIIGTRQPHRLRRNASLGINERHDPVGTINPIVEKVGDGWRLKVASEQDQAWEKAIAPSHLIQQ